jgi:hypothetical protein
MCIKMFEIKVNALFYKVFYHFIKTMHEESSRP